MESFAKNSLILVFPLSIIALFFLAYLLQILTYILFYKTYLFSQKKQKTSTDISVSVIICSKNEAQNLTNNLPIILEQTHDNYEVIIVNDRSEDNTKDIVKGLMLKHKHLRLINIEETNPKIKGKRNALIKGVGLAKNEMLVFTDADCKPKSKYWISDLTNCRNPKTELILGHAPFYIKSGFIQYLFRFENSFTAIKYYSAYVLGKPYMGVGRNMAVSKKLFLDNIQLLKNHKSISGDDDLLVNAIANKSNTQLCFSSRSFMYSEASLSLKEYFIRKRRHLSAGVHYRVIHMLLLGLVFFNPLILNLLFVISFGWALSNKHERYKLILLALFIIIYTAKYMTYNKLFTLFDNNTPLRLFPVLDLFYFIITLSISISLIFNPRIKWQ